MAILIGIHPVAEALRAGRPLDRVLVARGSAGARMQEIIELARKSDTPLRFEARDAIDRMAGGTAHQGVIALGAATRYADLEKIAETAKLLVALDGVEDPHNLGALIRTAHAAGADAIIIPERRAVGLTEVVAKAAAGAIEHLPVSRVVNLNRTLEDLKRRGFWIYGLDQRGTIAHSRVEWAEPTVIVLGGEGRGLHELVRKHCDALVRIPMDGQIASLNVSVAAGIVLFSWKERNSSFEGDQS